MVETKKTLNTSNLYLVREGITMRVFNMTAMITAYTLFFTLQGFYPEVIKMTKKQYQVYKADLLDLAEILGIKVSEQQKNRQLTFRETPIEIIKE